MSHTTLKLSLAVAGIAVFFFGMRAGSQTIRWAGIALVAVAWALRFVGRQSE